MSKKEFLKKLSRALDTLPKAEREKTVAYYDEQIEDRKEAGATEEAAVDVMGDIKTIANDIIQDARERGVEIKKRGLPGPAKAAIIVVSVLVGLAIIGGCISAAFVFTGFKNSGEFHRIEKVCELNDNGLIEIDMSQYDLYLGRSADDKVHISYYLNEDIMTFTVTDTPEKLTVVQKQKWFAGLFFNHGVRQAEMLVPESFVGSIVSHISTGDTRIDHLTSVASLDIRDTTGDIIVYDSQSKTASFTFSTGDVIIGRCSFEGALEVNGTTGDAELAHTECESLLVRTTTGDIKLENVTASSIETGLTTGDISLKNVTSSGRLYAHSTTGEIHFELLDANDIEFSATTGSISGTLVGSDADYTIESSVSTGRNTLPESWGHGPRKLKAKATTGDIRIYFSEN